MGCGASSPVAPQPEAGPAPSPAAASRYAPRAESAVSRDDATSGGSQTAPAHGGDEAVPARGETAPAASPASAARYTRTFAADYRLAGVLGQGGFAEVRLATRAVADPAGRIPATCAVKIIDRAKVEDAADIAREIELMCGLQHRHIVRLFEVFEEPSRVSLVMDHAAGGELFDFICDRGSLTEREAAGVMQQLCAALDYLHGLRIYHRDMKADNVLVCGPAGAPAGGPPAVKIADFGAARRCAAGERMATACGTPFYVAPEVLAGAGYEGGGMDLWSVGVLLYIMLCGYPPFCEDDLTALFGLIKAGRYAFGDEWAGVSDDARDVVRGLLVVEPASRWTASRALACAWVGGGAAAEAPLADGALAGLREHNRARKLQRAGQRVVQLQRAGLLQRGAG